MLLCAEREKKHQVSQRQLQGENIKLKYFIITSFDQPEGRERGREREKFGRIILENSL